MISSMCQVLSLIVTITPISSRLNQTKPSESGSGISSVLTLITHNQTYDKRLRPHYGGPPINVSVGVHVIKVADVSELQMDFTLDMNLRHSWNDPRLKWKGFSTAAVKVTDYEYIKTFWIPATCFPNEKRASYHRATINQTYLHITNSGTVTKFQRITITLSCPMNLRYFPLDSQVCELLIESYGYTSRDLKLVWTKTDSMPVKILHALNLPTFELSHLTFEENIFVINKENYSRLHCKFTFNRVLPFYWIQIYQPSIMVVMVSWVAFWISRDSAPARVTLSISTVLAMTTLMSQTNQQLPKVSYVKAVDVYLVGCYIMVIAALLEYAAVGYSNKKKGDLKVHVSSLPISHELESGGSQTELSCSSTEDEKSSDMDEKISLPRRGSVSQNGHLLPLKQNGHTVRTYRNPNTVSTVVEVQQQSKKIVHKPFNGTVQALSSNVDKYSRIIFPITFAVFNTVYWIYYLTVSGKLQIY